MNRIITLLTDFGLQDGYVAAMKGVILGICPDTCLVDVTHMVPPQDIRFAAFTLSTMYADFPDRTIHLAVVDPGVGTERRALAVRTARHILVGPDNGLFSLVLQRETGWKARVLADARWWRPVVSRTFHGRDIFAPVAAHLAAGRPFEDVGPPCEPVAVSWGMVETDKDGLRGEVLAVDRFGNVITNITVEHLRRVDVLGDRVRWCVQTGRTSIETWVETYGEAAPGAAVVLVGSGGYMEIAVCQGNAAEMLGVKPGSAVKVKRRG